MIIIMQYITGNEPNDISNLFYDKACAQGINLVSVY